MLPDTTYSGSLPHPTSFMVYQIDQNVVNSNDGYVMVEFA
jgi:hypothetical protein